LRDARADVANIGIRHGWVVLFAAPPDGSIANIVEGVLASIAAAWLAATLFVGVYNRLLARS
jgi:hypothetical protein